MGGVGDISGSLLRAYSVSSVNVIKRQRNATFFCGRDDTPRNVNGHLLAPLLVMRDIPLRHTDGFAKGDLGQAEPLADVKDVVHA